MQKKVDKNNKMPVETKREKEKVAHEKISGKCRQRREKPNEHQ